MSLPKMLPVTGSKRPAPSDNIDAAVSAANQEISLSQNIDEDAMDISGDDVVGANGDYCPVAKRLKTRATVGHGNGLLAISVASTNDPHIHTGLPTTGGAETNTKMLDQSTQSLALDVEDQAKEVSPKGNKAGLLFSQMITAQLPEQLDHLHANYSFSSIEIGGYSRYDQAVQAVARLVGRFNVTDMHMKPTIVVLTSMATFAGRLIAIVEGAKARIAVDKDQWFQYNEMHGVIVPKKSKIEKRIGGGQMLRGWDEEQKSKTKAKEVAKDGDGEAMDVDEDVFQTMARRKSVDFQAVLESENNKIRHTPVITIFLARLRVPELATLYGYVDFFASTFRTVAADNLR